MFVLRSWLEEKCIFFLHFLMEFNSFQSINNISIFYNPEIGAGHLIIRIKYFYNMCKVYFLSI